MRKTLIAAAIFLSSHSAFAEQTQNQATMSNFSYDYAEARIGGSPMTFGAAMSKSIHPNAHVVGSIDSKFKGDYDISGGLGFHAPVNNWADFTGEMLAHVFDSGDHHKTKAGMEINLGVRQWLGPQLEIGGKAGYLNIEDFDRWMGSIYGRFHSTELFSLGLEGRINHIYGDQLMFTARFKF
jgi:uncharacterized protein YdeI (BOF family)